MRNFKSTVALQKPCLKKVPGMQAQNKREMMLKMLVNMSWEVTSLLPHSQNG
ncbi:hypothetical protein Lalb_Chr04g0252961 [Lupinus albus]|uniref:Uncharacterized protein n=1 Tax=Lupinus albus TaxID=3870 RepID=A0A6A4QNJ7_LUPAL|nr:hypothetical protein Lalb_Chr04g0252961 [Lupinus albus]